MTHCPSRFEKQIEEGKLSRDGKPGNGGLETVACGGMHTLAIDEAGKVSPSLLSLFAIPPTIDFRSDHGASTTTLPWAV